MQPLERLSDNVRKIRKDRGLSQEQLALQADIDRSYISQLERDTRNVAFENILKIARALGVSLSHLVEGIE
ncbi:helix-turn-helix transcriptional regulator [Novosphingobium sp.]|uniref:helix-turn-helix domain-containing protein n=1 Tax=Novosphingobium sp. TaxID=1874826 RepID=UPI002B47A25B|nr:helix-turn-helix transcriptional regulator [Novosphingobium sp.]HKR91257.1 helix-turn-helix transcriptional regulator [Novosphingobium sp.]